jgi:hypothetical protein
VWTRRKKTEANERARGGNREQSDGGERSGDVDEDVTQRSGRHKRGRAQM